MNSGDDFILKIKEDGDIEYRKILYSSNHSMSPKLEIVNFRIDSISSIISINYFDNTNIDGIKSIDTLSINHNNRIRVKASLAMIEEKYCIYSFTKDLILNKANIESYELELISCDEESQILDSHWIIDEKSNFFYLD